MVIEEKAPEGDAEGISHPITCIYVGSQYFPGWLRQLVESLPEYSRIVNGFIFHTVSFLF